MSVKKFWSRVDRTTSAPCWIWTGALDAWGYGRAQVDLVSKGAHRIAYELSVGPIPDGMVLDHLCRTRACVNPNHLEVVTVAENNRRAAPYSSRSLKTHCKHGHEFSPENTYIRMHRNGRPHRTCRACNKRLVAESKARRTAATR